MPKPKPDKVIRHEIVLGRSEKEMLDSLTGSLAFKNVATPIVTLMNDVTGTITFLSLIAAVGLTGVSFTFLVSEELSVQGVIDSFISQRDQAAVAAGIGGLPGVPFGGGIISQWLGLLDQES
jgi:hypothetical protein